MRLDRFVCKSTQLSKSQAIAEIQSGNVTVNAKHQHDESTQVHENNIVQLNQVTLHRRAFRYIAMNKPAGSICSNIDEAYPSIFNYLDVEHVSELHIVGRLDADSTGLLLITDDGRWSFNVTRPEKECQKVYRVKLARSIKNEAVAKFSHGIQLQGESQLTKPAVLKVVSSKEALLTITEGKFHQVKRMFAAIGNRVLSLHREAIGDINLDMDTGQWRYLTPLEVQSVSQPKL
jgi:16S rRNA pseudouridine516 synthase